MKKLEQQPNQTKIFSTISEAWKDVRDGFMARKDYFTALGIVFAITALFLNAGTDNLFLRKIQALFLVASSLLIGWLIFSTVSSFFKGKHVELYYAISLVFVWIGGLLIVNLFGYLYTSFKDELFFYLRWLGVPIIAILVNLLSIYFFRIISKSGKLIKGDILENFFLISLNFHLVSVYYRNGLDFVATIKYLISFKFGTLFIIYLFLLAVYDELYLWDKINRFIKSKTGLVVFGSFYLFLIILPLFLKYVLPLLM